MPPEGHRQIVLDTETTGLVAEQGHRVIEIGAIELIDRVATGRQLHLRIDPERDIERAASEVHGMTWEALRGMPVFGAVAAEFVEFVRGAEWIIHNAPFDIGFLDAELDRAACPRCAMLYTGVIDTVALARDLFPGRRNNLNALCERLGIDTSSRTLHGALLDAQLLTQAYLALTRGQGSLLDDSDAPVANATPARVAGDRAALLIIAPTAEELAAHAAYLADLERETKGKCLWLAREGTTLAA